MGESRSEGHAYRNFKVEDQNCDILRSVYTILSIDRAAMQWRGLTAS